MSDGALRVLLFLAVCLAAAAVQGASRASRPGPILRHTVRAFLPLAGGITLLCVGIWLLTAVTQG